MALFDLSHVSFTYPGAARPSLDDVTLSFERGEFCVICGLNGSGKTTLLRCLKTILAPHGDFSGAISFNGTPLEKMSAREQAARIAFVMQDPNAQAVTDTVGDELAFGLENLGVDSRTMHVHIAETATFFNLQDKFNCSIDTLSGGQRQTLNLACAMTLRPDVVILDEPTSQLDPVAAQEFLAALVKVNRETGVTVIVTEQRLADIMPYADRVIAMDQGRVLFDSSPCEVAGSLADTASPLRDGLPEPFLIYRETVEMQALEHAPLSVRDGRLWLEQATEDVSPLSVRQVQDLSGLTDATGTQDASHIQNYQGSRNVSDVENKTTSAVVDVRNVSFRYAKTSPDILKDCSLTVQPGTIHALLGGNGVGKSTLLKAIAGILKPYRGSIRIYIGRTQSSDVVLLPQNPADIFVRERIVDDLADIAKAYGVTEVATAIDQVAKECGIAPLLARNPYDVSGGELQRAAIAAVLLGNPKVLLLDEPTKAVDAGFKTKLAALLHRLADEGITIVLATHDVRFTAEHADMCTIMFDGCDTATGTPHDILAANTFYTTEASRMSRGIFKGAITVADVVVLCKENGIT